MKTITIAFLLTILLPLTTYAYDLPVVLCEINGGDSFYRYAEDFCCIGDQNGDGFDDLLVHDQSDDEVQLYHGGREMDYEIDLLFTTEMDSCVFNYGSQVMNLGRILPEHDPFIGISFKYWPPPEDTSFYQLRLFECNEDLTDEPDMVITKRSGLGPAISKGRHTRPTDLNGDGFHDMITGEYGDSLNLLQIYFGGEEFDTIPDWQISVEARPHLIEYSNGCDVNSDGYDDFLIKKKEYRGDDLRMYWYSLFLGGEEMDTIPVIDFREDHFEGRHDRTRSGRNSGFSLLQDVNDDGYDDWGMHFTERYGGDGDDGFYIFFGSEEPDMEPDLILEGHRRLWIDEGDIASGDFNGDGIGDIVTSVVERQADMADIFIHFGSERIDEEADIYINTEREYGGRYDQVGKLLGAVGDYNGDGLDDFVATIETGRVIIFAANESWYDVNEDELIPDSHELILLAAPNPFNNQITISYQVPISGNVRLSVYDVQGRLVEQLTNLDRSHGEYTTTWNCRNSGIYLLLMQTETASVVKKVVCLK
ncbi:MAG: T9SS type A sorting domain-containing protein [Calditrichaeota bacterium]|nr:T9SS type A sorting domain-containing protein [Calditrichota bacterium]